MPATNEILFQGYVELLRGDGIVPVELRFEEHWGTSVWTNNELRDDIDGTLEDFKLSVGTKLYETLEDFKTDNFILVDSVWVDDELLPDEGE
jgi:hypothetical protein